MTNPVCRLLSFGYSRLNFKFQLFLTRVSVFIFTCLGAFGTIVPDLVKVLFEAAMELGPIQKLFYVI